jgi:hypothetical protein
VTQAAGRCALAWRPAVLLLLAACGRSPSGSPAPQPDPTPLAQRGWAARLDELLASMPEPSADRGFTFEGEIEYGVPQRGSFRVEVTAGVHQGLAAWRVVQDESRPAMPNGMAAGSEHRETWLARDLRTLAATATISDEGRPAVTVSEPAGRRTLSLAAAILYFRSCPAEVTAGPDPSPFPEVSAVAADGTLRGAADTSDAYRAFITLRGPGRTPVKVERFLGWHNMGTIEAREAPK